MLATASPVKLTLYPVQCVNMVTNDKTEPFFWNSMDAKLKLFKKMANSITYM